MTNDDLLKIDVCSRLPYRLVVCNEEGYFTCDAEPSKLNVGNAFGLWLTLKEKAKPILFPISCLTEEIQFRGEKIVPMIQLAKIDGHLKGIIEVRTKYDCLHIVEGEIFEDTYEPCRLDFVYNSEDHCFCIYNQQDVSPYDDINTLKLFDWMNAHMIDYRGLIDKGLAVSVFDLEHNPYSLNTK